MNFLLAKLDAYVMYTWKAINLSLTTSYGNNLIHFIFLSAVLVALYEKNEKPSSALEQVSEKIRGPTASEYEKLKAEISDLQAKYNEVLGKHEVTCKGV
ncbi:LOW QUALITY PROTEIN: uncharacterized protein LOC110424339 [Herrania umbratica]|uniref:LOW QUALITY PROTEIN: uncharacterized protein LOC110424339 n=1 Tax=Herrania umbratica TaxID=108875 RepID=A0A6J1B5G6_9ROSI|nr:LOW QUALITY PROTEIN: uncharacterized protein LOC110424339 [Herrania umbratica]